MSFILGFHAKYVWNPCSRFFSQLRSCYWVLQFSLEVSQHPLLSLNQSIEKCCKGLDRYNIDSNRSLLRGQVFQICLFYNKDLQSSMERWPVVMSTLVVQQRDRLHDQKYLNLVDWPRWPPLNWANSSMPAESSGSTSDIDFVFVRNWGSQRTS